MKKKLLTFVLAAAMLTVFLVSCDDTPAETSSVDVSSQPVSSETVSSEGGTESGDASSAEPTSSDAPQREIIKSHETYGEVKNHGILGDKVYYSFKKEQDDQCIFTICLYDFVTEEWTVVEQTDASDAVVRDPYHAYFHESGDVLIFHTGVKKEVGYYDVNTDAVGTLPLVDKDVSGLVFLHDFKPLEIKYKDGKFYWVETKYYEPVAETVYCYDVASGKRTTLYESDGKTWIYTYEPTEKGLYMKLYLVELVDDDGTCPCRYSPGEGDLLFYDGEKMTTVAENVYDFKLDEDGAPLVQETENGDWEELVTP